MTTKEPKFLLVSRRTRLEELIEKYNTVEQSKFYIEHLGGDFAEYQSEHNTYQNALLEVESQLSALGRTHRVDRAFLPNYVFKGDEIVVAVGQDGLVANTLKYVCDRPVIGVNPDPARYDGILLPFYTEDTTRIALETARGKRPITEVTLAKAALNNGQTLFAVNDLFIGPKTHTSARYEIQLGKQAEVQSSSGVIVSTGLGSTAWLQSILAGAQGVMGHQVDTALAKTAKRGVPWNANFLFYAVREPFPSKTSTTEMVFGKVADRKELLIHSHMPEYGVIFSDGMEADYIEFSAGLTARISVAERAGHLVQ